MHSAAGVTLGERDDEAKVGSEEMTLRALPVLRNPREFASQLRLELGGRHLGELVLGEQARLDAHREFDLLCRIEQRDLADLLQVVLDRVSGRASDRRRVDGNLVLVVDERENQRPRGKRLLFLGLLVVKIFVFDVVAVLDVIVFDVVDNDHHIDIVIGLLDDVVDLVDVIHIVSGLGGALDWGLLRAGFRRSLLRRGCLDGQGGVNADFVCRLWLSDGCCFGSGGHVGTPFTLIC